MPEPEPTLEDIQTQLTTEPMLVFANVPEFYADGLIFTATGFTITLSFMVTPPTPGPNRAVAIVRMSPEHAKVMAIALKKNMKAFEGQAGIEVAIPPAALQQFKIDLAQDW